MADSGFPAELASKDRSKKVQIVIWLLIALSGLFLALRVYCKFLRHRGLWWDDNLLIASWVSSGIVLSSGSRLSSFMFVMADAGFNRFFS